MGWNRIEMSVLFYHAAMVFRIFTVRCRFEILLEIYCFHAHARMTSVHWFSVRIAQLHYIKQCSSASFCNSNIVIARTSLMSHPSMNPVILFLDFVITTVYGCILSGGNLGWADVRLFSPVPYPSWPVKSLCLYTFCGFETHIMYFRQRATFTFKDESTRLVFFNLTNVCSSFNNVDYLELDIINQ